jgi:hypothetical protein
MRTVPRNIPIKFHRSNMKTERLVRQSLRSVKTLKNYKFFLAKIGPKKRKFKIPLPKPHAGSAKECSYKVSWLQHENWATSSQKFKIGQNPKKLQVFLAKIGHKKQKFKILLPNPHAGSAKECSYEVSSL